jgi:ceramide glucosyltransferase
VQPFSYAAQLAVVPAVGWLAWVVARPADAIAWFGLASLVVIEAAVAVLSCRLVGSRVPVSQWPLVAGWVILRALTSLACWLPWPIVWRGDVWWSARKRRPAAQGVVGPRSTSGAE